MRQYISVAAGVPVGLKLLAVNANIGELGNPLKWPFESQPITGQKFSGSLEYEILLALFFFKIEY